MPIITIDGNIGCGKSSILNHLHKMHKLPIDLEPIDSWNNYLSKMYDDKIDVFKFQVRIWLDRCWVQERCDKSLIFMERSPLFIKSVFIETAYSLAMINENEYNILLDLHTKTNDLWTSNTYIYLRSSSDNCLKRIKKRNRQSEKNITQEYVQILHDKHEEVFNKSIEKNMNIIVIDVDDKSITEIVNEILQYVKHKFSSLKYNI
jgi:deoxyadenosine/deoxycytidine kinase